MEQYCDLNEEIRNGYLVTAKMKAVWNIQLNMLVKLMEVCDKYGLKFYASAGTLLGAIRHKGYIPWDDDIDIEMLRDDYDKLLSIASKEFESPFFFQCPYTEKGYYRGHSQIRCEGTTAILPRELQGGRKFNQGIFIDIFVLDIVPSDKNLLQKRVNSAHSILDYLWMRRYPKSRINPIPFFKLVLKHGRKAFWSDVKLYSEFENLLREGDIHNSRIIAPLSFLPDRSSLYKDIEWYSEVKNVPFEKIKIPVPVGYDELLKKMYGDYMKPVQCPSIHGDVFFDVNKSYKEYLKKEQSIIVYIIERLKNKIRRFKKR